MRCVQFGPRAQSVFGLHPEQLEEPDPLRVDVVGDLEALL